MAIETTLKTAWECLGVSHTI